MLVFLSLLLGCGYKGPLYLPAPPDTLSGQGTVIEDTPPPTFSDTQNPSLEPSPIVIE
jgi:predicted small lipoprotein YifL